MAKKLIKKILGEEEVETVVEATEVETVDDGGFSKRHPGAIPGVIYE